MDRIDHIDKAGGMTSLTKHDEGTASMVENTARIATVVAAVGCGLTAGLLLAFSVSVMPALATRPPADAIATMQQINIAIVSPIFLTVFFGSALACIVAAGATLRSHSGSTVLVVVGAVLFLLGCIVVTVAVNVPLNDALAAVDVDAGAGVWTDYLDRWTRWNHGRTAAAALASVVLTLAARR